MKSLLEKLTESYLDVHFDKLTLSLKLTTVAIFGLLQ